MICQSLEFLTSKYDVYFVCFLGRNQSVDKDKISNLGILSSYYLNTSSFFRFVYNVILFRNKSLQECLYYSPSGKKFLDNVISNINPDVIICDMLRTSQFVDDSDVLVTDLDDLLSNRYENMLRSNSNYSVLGTYAQRLPKIFSQSEKLLRKILLSYECKKIRESEKRTYSKSNKVILTSPIEAKHINAMYYSDKATGVPQAVDCSELEFFDGIIKKLLFIGNMTTAQNIESLRFIVKEILPELIKITKNFEIVVIGKYDERLNEIIFGVEDKVKLLGFVDDLKVVASGCSVALMPVAFGTGIKTKVLDAMALGLPTVTNSVGIEGINAEYGKDVIVCDSPADIAKSVYNLLIYKNLSKQVSNNGIDFIRNNHSKKLLCNKYLSVIDNVARRNIP